MFEKAGPVITQRLDQLQNHLKRENPILIRVVDSFRELDKVAYRTGLLDTDDSFATQISWWPLVSVMGTFSSGKSSFINEYLGQKLQRTGNQAVDDRFTVLCYSREADSHVLPGLALDADPRLPFYQISDRIERAVEGEGHRIDNYLQLKTCTSERLLGKIMIDSPGFDADAQRTSTLQITEHIVDLSDLVLVFFDARHPEPGAMRDTLSHLVGNTIHRPDAGKFLFVLNQIDTAASEDNTEEVVGAWQRALAEKGLTAGHFFTIYNADAAVHIAEDSVRERFKQKRDADYDSIVQRLERVQVERAYRIVGALELTARDFEQRMIPELRSALASWRQRVLVMDVLIFGVLAAGGIFLEAELGLLSGLTEFLDDVVGQYAYGVWAGLAAGIAWFVHHNTRLMGARQVSRKIRRGAGPEAGQEMVARGFEKNVSALHSIFNLNPVGWGRSASKRVQKVLADADRYIQTLNDQFADPAGGDWIPPAVSTGAPPPDTEAEPSAK